MERDTTIMITVREWPTTIETALGIICNPTPQQCMDAGYVLEVPKTAEELEAERLAQEKIEADRITEIEGIRNQYRDACRNFCAVAGISVVDKFEDTDIIQTEIQKANAGGDLLKIISLTQLAILIDNRINELRRKDGDDAWLRV